MATPQQGGITPRFTDLVAMGSFAVEREKQVVPLTQESA
jgi:hypothetical protein